MSQKERDNVREYLKLHKMGLISREEMHKKMSADSDGPMGSVTKYWGGQKCYNRNGKEYIRKIPKIGAGWTEPSAIDRERWTRDYMGQAVEASSGTVFTGVNATLGIAPSVTISAPSITIGNIELTEDDLKELKKLVTKDSLKDVRKLAKKWSELKQVSKQAGKQLK